MKKQQKQKPAKKMSPKEQAAFSKKTSAAIQGNTKRRESIDDAISKAAAGPGEARKIQAPKKAAPPAPLKKLTNKDIAKKAAEIAEMTKQQQQVAKRKPSIAPLPPAEVVEKPSEKEFKALVSDDRVEETYAVFMDYHRHSCIFVSQRDGRVHYIPMESEGLDVKRMDAKTFHTEYQKLGYPTSKAAEIYLNAAQRFGCSEEAKQHLEFVINHMKGNIMDKKTAKKKPAVKATKVKKAKGATKAAKVAKVNDFDTKSVKLLVKENPKREGTSAHKKFELYKKHKKVADLLAAGGKIGFTRSTLRYDLAAKFIALV